VLGHTVAGFQARRLAAKGEILALGGPKIQATPFNIAEVINAFADYFKHRDE
jgi:hypothetical protein